MDKVPLFLELMKQGVEIPKLTSHIRKFGMKRTMTRLVAELKKRPRTREIASTETEEEHEEESQEGEHEPPEEEQEQQQEEEQSDEESGIEKEEANVASKPQMRKGT